MRMRLHWYTRPLFTHGRLIGAAGCATSVAFITVDDQITWLDALIFPLTLLGAWLLVDETLHRVQGAIDRSRRRTPAVVPLPSSAFDGFGARVTEELGKVTTLDELVELVPTLAVGACADWVTLYLPQRDSLVRVASRHADPALDAEVRKFVGVHSVRLDSENDVSRVFHRQTPLMAPQITPTALKEMAADPEYATKLQPLKLRAAIGWPIIVGQHCYGVIGFIRTGGADRMFSDDDIARINAFMARVSTTFAAVSPPVQA